jgi:diguanylate cyclase (GGDEF)-like protein
MQIDRTWTQAQLRLHLERVLSPVVCFRVYDLLRHPSADYAAIADAAMADPYLSSRIVAMANLARGQSKVPIVSLQRALQTLGTRHTHMLLISIMLAAPLLECPQQQADPDLRRWVLSLAAAGPWLAARASAAPAAPQGPKSPEECLLAGLILGMGVLILRAGLGPVYDQVLGSPPSILALRQAERENLHITHDQITIWALEALHCPPALGMWAFGATAPEQPPLPRAVEVLAASIARLDPGAAEAYLADALPRLGIDPLELFDDQLPGLRQRVAELAKVFQIDVGDLGLNEHPQAFLRTAGDTMQSLLADSLTVREEMSSELHREAIQAIAEEAAAQGADTDPLTGVLNRRGLDHWLSAQAEAAPVPLSILMIDVDNFKQVNDHWGHAAGDLALAEIARVLRHTSPRPLALARLGGDEFLAIYPTPTRAELDSLAASIVATVAQKPPGDRRRSPSASAG